MNDQGSDARNAVSTMNAAMGTALAFPFGPGVIPWC